VCIESRLCEGAIKKVVGEGRGRKYIRLSEGIHAGNKILNPYRHLPCINVYHIALDSQMLTVVLIWLIW
jgi:hypothetical protein